MEIRLKFGWIALAYGMLFAAVPTAALAQWQAALAKVTVRSNLDRSPGTAFVVAIRNHTAYLVTSAHVVAGDDSPTINFQVDPDTSLTAVKRDIQGNDTEHGLAFLAVSNAPNSVRSLVPSAGSTPAVGEAVIVAGYPSAAGVFAAPSTTIASQRGQDLFLSSPADEGFSGGPVLRADGSVVGLIWGTRGSLGVAVVSELVKLYMDRNGVTWKAATEDNVTKEAPQVASKPRGKDDGNAQIYRPYDSVSLFSNQLQTIVRRTSEPNRDHFSVEFTVAPLPARTAADTAPRYDEYTSIDITITQTVPQFRPLPQIIPTIHGHWAIGQKGKIDFDLPRVFTDPSRGWDVRFCIESGPISCIPSPNLLLGAPVT